MRHLLLVLLFLAVPAVGQAQTCFAMNMDSSAQNLAGWPDVRTDETGVPVMYGTIWTMAYLPTGGPNGTPAYRQRHIGGAAGTGYYSGWQGTLCNENIPPQGSSRFVRMLFRYVPTNNFQCGGSGTNCNFKVVIHADACSSDPSGGNGSCRAILEIGGRSAIQRYSFQLAIGGGGIPARTGTVYTAGTWYALQYELDSSSTPTTADGCFKVWVNNPNYSSPTVTNGCDDVVRTGSNTTGWGTIKFAGFHNEAAHAPGDVDDFEIAGFEYARSFDPTFTVGATPLGPPPPVNVRIEEQVTP